MTAQRLLSFIAKMKLSDLPGRLGQAWLLECSDLIPERALLWLFGRGRGLVAIATGSDMVNVELMANDRRPIATARVSIADFRAGYIDQFVCAHGFDRLMVDIGVRLPLARFFRRRLVLPAEAEDSLDEIATKDLVRKTPFRLQDVYCAHVATRLSESDKILVWQWVARRDVVSRALAELGPEGDRAVFADAERDRSADTPAPFIWLCREGRVGRSWTATVAMVLALVSGMMVAGIGGLRYWRQEVALAGLDGRIAVARAQAKQVRADIDAVKGRQEVLVRLRARKSDAPRLLDIWEEVTRLLPSHSWLTELRLGKAEGDGARQVTLAGYSSAATSLIIMFDRSPLFMNATLSAPVTFDPTEARERFALRVNVSERIQHGKGAQ